ncbi:MAG: YDG domain-containing protein [Dysosmobacter sp.]
MDGWTFGEAAKELQVNGLPTGVELTDPAVTVTYTNTKDGTTSSKRPTDAGSYTVTVSYETDTVIHTGTKDFTISKREIAVPTADSRQFEYTGQEQTYVLGNFADAAYYTVSGAMTRTDAGSQNVTVQLKDKNNTVWKGGTDADKTYVFTIAPKPLSKVTIGDFFDRTYTGLPIRPAVTPADGNTALTEDTDYTVSYGANTNVGQGNDHGHRHRQLHRDGIQEWNITPAVLTISGVTVADKTYNGSADATVTAVAFDGLKNGEKLKIGTDYEVIGAAFNDENVNTANKVTGTVALKGTEKAKNYTLSSAAFEQAATIGRGGL